jgi:hypothetical protein
MLLLLLRSQVAKLDLVDDAGCIIPERRSSRRSTPGRKKSSPGVEMLKKKDLERTLRDHSVIAIPLMNIARQVDRETLSVLWETKQHSEPECIRQNPASNRGAIVIGEMPSFEHQLISGFVC